MPPKRGRSLKSCSASGTLDRLSALNAQRKESFKARSKALADSAAEADRALQGLLREPSEDAERDVNDAQVEGSVNAVQTSSRSRTGSKESRSRSKESRRSVDRKASGSDQKEKEALRRKDEEIERLKEELEGMQRQRTELVWQVSDAKMRSTVKAVGYGGTFPPCEELSIEQAERKAVQNRLGQVKSALQETKVKLMERELELSRETQLRKEREATLAKITDVNRSMQETFVSVGGALKKITRADGTLDPTLFVLELASLALPHIEVDNDPLMAMQQLQAVVDQSFRPPLLPTHTLSAIGAGTIAPRNDASDLLPSSPTRTQPMVPAMWPTEDGLHSSGMGLTLGWPPEPLALMANMH